MTNLLLVETSCFTMELVVPIYLREVWRNLTQVFPLNYIHFRITILYMRAIISKQLLAKKNTKIHLHYNFSNLKQMCLLAAPDLNVCSIRDGRHVLINLPSMNTWILRARFRKNMEPITFS